jgi:hypothetical protein
MYKFKIPTKSTYFSSAAVTHQQMMNELFEFAMKWGRLIGVNIFDKDYDKANRRVVLVQIVTILTFILNVYDIYLFRKDLVRWVFCILTLSGQFRAIAMINTFIRGNDNILNLRKQSEKFHEHYSSLNTTKMYETNLLKVAHVTASFTLFGILTFIFVTLYPVIYFWIFDERILHFGTELPFIDWKYSWIGYGINFIFHVAILFVYLSLMVTSMCIIINILTSGICQYDVLDFLLDELNELIVQNKDGSKNSEIRKKIKFLIETHLNLIQYLQEMRQTFKIYYFIDLSALVIQKTVTLFVMISVSCQK